MYIYISSVWSSRADERLFLHDMDEHTQVILAHDGNVSWSPITLARTSCEVSVADYPFDTQECFYTIGPWTYGTSVLALSSPDKSLKHKLSSAKQWVGRHRHSRRRDPLKQTSVNLTLMCIWNFLRQNEEDCVFQNRVNVDIQRVADVVDHVGFLRSCGVWRETLPRLV